MIVSAARVLASQANGKKSKGPVTPEGKAVSRCNSLKHGLTGAGIVLPDEDAAEVSKRFDDLQAQFNPATPMGKILVHRVALLSVRLERSAEHEAAYLGEKIRHAQESYDEECQVAVEDLMDQLADRPGLCVRRLLRTPQGVDALIGAWHDLREDLTRPNLDCWTKFHADRANLLTGRRANEIPISRINELSAAIRGDFDLLRDREGEGLDDPDRRAWARDLLVELIDEELEGLRVCRAGLDLAAFEQDRVEAGRRALFDVSKPAVLARRYEAASERGMFRALKQLKQVETEAASNPQPCPAYPVGPLGSFRSEVKGPVEAEIEAEMVAEMVSEAGLMPRSGSISGHFEPVTDRFGGRGGVNPAHSSGSPGRVR